MTGNQKKLLADIVTAINNIDLHLEGKRVFSEFALNITKRRVVERELEIVGEAVNNLLKIDPDISLTSARKIVNLRNRVIHAYDNLDEIILWKVIMKDIPVLADEVQILLGQDDLS